MPPKITVNKSLSQPNLQSTETSNVTNRKRKPNPDMQDLLALKQEIGEMIENIKSSQQTQTNQLQNSIDELHAQNREIIKTNSNIEKLLVQTNALYNDIKIKVDSLESGHNDALLRISALEEQVEDFQRNQRVATLEIRNMPETENENLDQIVTNIHNFLSIPVSTEHHIKQIKRIKASKNKVIIVEYTNLRTSSAVMKALKIYNNNHKEDKFNTTCLNLPGKKHPIFIGESLTPTARKLFFLARGLRKDHGYQYCWTSMGRVFVKYAEGSPAIHLKSTQQVEALKGSSAAELSLTQRMDGPTALASTTPPEVVEASITSPGNIF